MGFPQQNRDEGAVSSKANAPEAGRQFLDFLNTPFAHKAIRDSGLDLPKGP